MHRIAAALALVVLVPASEAAAGPWAPEPGHGYAKLWLRYLYGFDYRAGDGTTYGYGAYHEASLSVYAELGLVETLGFVLHSDILRTFHLEDPRDGHYESHVTVGDPLVALRWQFLSLDRFVMAVEAGVRAPFARPGPVQIVYGTDEGNPAVGALRVGTGVWDVPVSVGAGYGWDAFYLAGSAGYVLRTDGFEHVVTWTLEGGASLRDEGLGVRGRVVGYHSIGVAFDPAAARTESPSGINNGTSYVGFAVEGDYQFAPSWFVGASIEGGFGIARQTQGPVVTVYAATRF